MSNLDAIYRDRHDRCLVPIASSLEQFLTDLMHERPKVSRIDRIAARAKAPDSFMMKSGKKNADGSAYYTDPLTQIQDQIGARIIVFYLDDIRAAAERVMKYLTVAEQSAKEPESEWEFGYFGQHYVLSLPGDAIQSSISVKEAPRQFELQIRTLFQHAWSESDHDIVYKAKNRITRLQARQCAYAAAQAWGADRVFQELFDQTREEETGS